MDENQAKKRSKLIIFIALLIVAGLFEGFSMILYTQNQSLDITSNEINALKSLRNKPKFYAEGFYPSAPNNSVQVESEARVNALLDTLIVGLPQHPNKKYVMSQFKQALDSFETNDTEERERFCQYLEEIMDILKIESSDGLLNRWLYGFDPGL
jgi:flagellar basal body-associated protein FliL